MRRSVVFRILVFLAFSLKVTAFISGLRSVLLLHR